MSDEHVMTYEALYEMLRQEKFRPEVQGLDVRFYAQVVKYFTEKKAILSSQENKQSIFASASIVKTRKQIENLQKILKDLYERRENKVLQLALLSSRTQSPMADVDALLKEEKELYTQLVALFDAYRLGILGKLLSCEMPSVAVEGLTKSSSGEVSLVRFVHPVPAFQGLDLSVYGPFEKEEVASLPVELVKVLVDRGRVEKV